MQKKIDNIRVYNPHWDLIRSILHDHPDFPHWDPDEPDQFLKEQEEQDDRLGRAQMQGVPLLLSRPGRAKAAIQELLFDAQMSTITQWRPVRVSINNRRRRRRRRHELPLKLFPRAHPFQVVPTATTITMLDSATTTTTPTPTASPALPIQNQFPATSTPQQPQPPAVRSLLDQALLPPPPLDLVQARVRVRVRAGRSNVRGARRVGIGPLRRSGGMCPDPQTRTRTQSWQHESDNSLLVSKR